MVLDRRVEVVNAGSRQMSLAAIRGYIRRVQTYATLRDDDIQVVELAYEDFAPLQTVLTPRKLRRADLAIDEHRKQRLELFSSIWLPWRIDRELGELSNVGDAFLRLWLPPIIERHDDLNVIIDGHHRIYRLCDKSDGMGFPSKIQVIMLRNVTLDPPARPFTSMYAWKRHGHVSDELYRRGRMYRYRDFRPRLWREIPIFCEPISPSSDY